MPLPDFLRNMMSLPDFLRNMIPLPDFLRKSPKVYPKTKKKYFKKENKRQTKDLEFTSKLITD